MALKSVDTCARAKQGWGGMYIAPYPVTKSNAESSLLTSRSGLNAFLPVELFVCFTFPLPFPTLSPRFCDDGLASERSISPLPLERRVGS